MEQRKMDIAGKRAGRLLIIKKLPGAGSKWECICECGRRCYVSRSNLTSAINNKSTGTTKSCGCLRQKPAEDVTGQKFGRLTALRLVERDVYGRPVWQFMCEYGTTTKKCIHLVKKGNVRSCGCKYPTSTWHNMPRGEPVTSRFFNSERDREWQSRDLDVFFGRRTVERPEPWANADGWDYPDLKGIDD